MNGLPVQPLSPSATTRGRSVDLGVATLVVMALVIGFVVLGLLIGSAFMGLGR